MIHASPVSKDYLKHEAFIWKDLVARAIYAVQQVKNKWKEKQRITRMIISWPSKNINIDGKEVHLITFAIPDGMPAYKAAVDLVVKTKAYSILVIDCTATEVKLILESPHGAHAWTFPIKRHGDVRVLAPVIHTENKEHMGILWKPTDLLN